MPSLPLQRNGHVSLPPRGNVFVSQDSLPLRENKCPVCLRRGTGMLACLLGMTLSAYQCSEMSVTAKGYVSLPPPNQSSEMSMTACLYVKMKPSLPLQRNGYVSLPPYVQAFVSLLVLWNEFDSMPVRENECPAQPASTWECLCQPTRALKCVCQPAIRWKWMPSLPLQMGHISLPSCRNVFVCLPELWNEYDSLLLRENETQPASAEEWVCQPAST